MNFFFSSRRRHTRLVSDWSSDVCSSDLLQLTEMNVRGVGEPPGAHLRELQALAEARQQDLGRSEERRVGKECRSRWARYGEKKINANGAEKQGYRRVSRIRTVGRGRIMT